MRLNIQFQTWPESALCKHGTCGGQSNNDGADRIHPHPPQPTATVFQVVHTGIVVEQSEGYVGVERHTHVISALFRRRRSVGHLLRSHLARGNACLIQTFQVCFCSILILNPLGTPTHITKTLLTTIYFKCWYLQWLLTTFWDTILPRFLLQVY